MDWKWTLGMDRKWIRNEPEMDRERTKMEREMYLEWGGKGARMDRECTGTGTEMD